MILFTWFKGVIEISKNNIEYLCVIIIMWSLGNLNLLSLEYYKGKLKNIKMDSNLQFNLLKSFEFEKYFFFF